MASRTARGRGRPGGKPSRRKRPRNGEEATRRNPRGLATTRRKAPRPHRNQSHLPRQNLRRMPRAQLDRSARRQNLRQRRNPSKRSERSQRPQLHLSHHTRPQMTSPARSVSYQSFGKGLPSSFRNLLCTLLELPRRRGCRFLPKASHLPQRSWLFRSSVLFTIRTNQLPIAVRCGH